MSSFIGRTQRFEIYMYETPQIPCTLYQQLIEYPRAKGSKKYSFNSDYLQILLKGLNSNGVPSLQEEFKNFLENVSLLENDKILTIYFGELIKNLHQYKFLDQAMTHLKDKPKLIIGMFEYISSSEFLAALIEKLEQIPEVTLTENQIKLKEYITKATFHFFGYYYEKKTNIDNHNALFELSVFAQPSPPNEKNSIPLEDTTFPQKYSF